MSRGGCVELSMRVSREKFAESRKRILDAAATLFRETGFDGIGLSDIMKAAGLTHGGFYGHFGSKEDLEAQALDPWPRSLVNTCPQTTEKTLAKAAHLQHSAATQPAGVSASVLRSQRVSSHSWRCFRMSPQDAPKLSAAAKQ